MNIKIITFGLTITYIMNLVWENAQAFLYKGYENFWQHFTICAIASVGDVAIVVLIYIVTGLLSRDMFWLKSNKALRIWPYFAVVILGFFISVVIEKWALSVGRWQYAEMPLIPILDVGLIPVLQMMIIPISVFYMLNLKYNKREQNI